MGSETVLREEEPQHPSNGSNTVSEIMICDRAHNINLNQPQCPGCSDKSGMQENKRCRGKGMCQEDGLKSPRKGDFLQDSTDRQSSISVRGPYFQICQFKFQIGDPETAVCLEENSCLYSQSAVFVLTYNVAGDSTGLHTKCPVEFLKLLSSQRTLC